MTVSRLMDTDPGGVPGPIPGTPSCARVSRCGQLPNRNRRRITRPNAASTFAKSRRPAVLPVTMTMTMTVTKQALTKKMKQAAISRAIRTSGWTMWTPFCCGHTTTATVLVLPDE
ncbi:hypothetical protein RHA1_ro00795 [Rhodococcus jostii RHA1]|uniref:Uncharacterized protein n=1 Tax=Rhodococcus jostii (strain RHA1) TaxID=101510 RepID=Q0SIK6_RHOJR|nr:hypothetical protein RHA1_ro00795 [Rhodococcus jostii RHA1]